MRLEEVVSNLPSLISRVLFSSELSLFLTVMTVIKVSCMKVGDIDDFALDLNSDDQSLSVSIYFCVCTCFNYIFKSYLGCDWKINESSNMYSIIYRC